MGWGGVGLVTFLSTCTPTWCYVGDGMGWGGADGTCRYADVTLMEHVATLAHVVTIPWCYADGTNGHLSKKNRVKFNNRFVVAGTQQLDLKVLKKWKPIAFVQKDKSHGGTTENRCKWARSFQWRHNASITSSIFSKNFPHACGRVEKRCAQAVRTWNFLMKNNFQTCFSQCDKRTIFLPARNTIFSILNWPAQYKMTLSKCLPNMKNAKALGFNHFTLWMMEKNLSTVPGRRVSRFPCFWLSADSPPQKGCQFSLLYTWMLCKEWFGPGTARWGGVGWG